jgi:hypothetical protein
LPLKDGNHLALGRQRVNLTFRRAHQRPRPQSTGAVD